MTLIKQILLMTAGVSLLSACVSGTPELSGLSPQAQAEIIKNYGGVYKVGKPYKIAGKWYYPKEDYNYSEVGVASWYGEDFNGKSTANGERYNMNTLTAAHRTLPLPSIVKVTNLQNGRAIILRVNDRGPYVKDRIIDLSKRGAKLLGYMGQGTTKVKVEVMAAESKALKEAMLNHSTSKSRATAAAAVPAQSLYETTSERQEISQQIADQDNIYVGADGKHYTYGLYDQIPEENYATSASNSTAKYVSGSYYLQAGSFTQYALAHKLKVRLQEYGTSKIYSVNINGVKFYRVALGPYNREEEAKVAKAKLKYYGFLDTKIEQK